MPSWDFLRQKKDEEKVEEKKDELPDVLKARLDATDAKMSGIDEKLKGLDSISAYFAEKKAEEEEEKKNKNKPKVKTSEETQAEDEELAAMLLTDPKKAISQMTSPIQQLLLQTRADNIKREVFTDRADEFPYYTGEIRTEVDKILNEQTLQFRNDPNAVANTYHTVVGRKMKDINEGKIKSRFAGGSNPLSNAQENKDDEIKIEMSDDIKRMAKLSGMSEADALILVNKAAKAGEIDYV